MKYKVLKINKKSKAFFFEKIKVGDLLEIEILPIPEKLRVSKNNGEEFHLSRKRVQQGLEKLEYEII